MSSGARARRARRDGDWLLKQADRQEAARRRNGLENRIAVPAGIAHPEE
jgi:hypothetical protein